MTSIHTSLEKATFTVQQDHTLGNCVTTVLNQHPNVQYAAYVIPHENVRNDQIKMTVRTNGKQTPAQVVEDGISHVREIFDTICQEFLVAMKSASLSNESL